MNTDKLDYGNMQRGIIFGYFLVRKSGLMNLCLYFICGIACCSPAHHWLLSGWVGGAILHTQIKDGFGLLHPGRCRLRVQQQ